MGLKTETHFVARVVMERVDKVIESTNARGYPEEGLPKVGDRTVTEIATILVKDQDLVNMKSRVMAHVDLIQDL